MATYTQWAKSRTVRRLTWACGPESVLVRDVVAAHQDGAVPDQRVTLYAGDVPEHEVWSVLLGSPPPGGRRAVVYGAEKLKQAGNVVLLAADDGLDSAYAVFVSSAADFERKGTALAPHLAALQSSKAGQLIRCCAPSKADDQLALVASWWPGLTPNMADDLLNRSGSLEAAWHACQKGRLARLEPSRATVAAVCPAEPAGDLADLLMAGRRAEAMALARLVGRAEVPMFIGLLASRLAVAEQIREEMKRGLTAREASWQAPVDRFSASRVAPHVGAYEQDRIDRCRRVLVRAEAAHKTGAPAGVMETLVALW
jgi:hypothetical protein